MGAVLVALTFAIALPALGTWGWWGSWGSSPSKECADHDWNGKYWKAEFKHSLKIKDIETNVAESTINLSVDKHKKKVSWALDDGFDHALFRIYEKAGHDKDVNSGFWLPGEKGSVKVDKSLSHITFCFSDIPEPEISIKKTTNGSDPISANPVSNFVAAGEQVKWTYVVKNTGEVTLKNIVVSDDREGEIGTADVLHPGKSVTFTETGKAETSTYPVGYANVATVVAKSKLTGESVEATDSSGYYGSAPSINLAVDGPDEPVLLGNEFLWTFTVTNTGNVPLTGVVVKEDGATVGNCDLGVLAPDTAGATCTFTDVATVGEEVSTFEAKGIFDDGETQTVISTTIAGVEYEINQPPTANDDSYEMAERDGNGPLTLDVPAPGVLGNDSDPEDDPLTASDATTTDGGAVTLNADGSFAYTPDPAHEWGDDEFSRVETFEYTVSDDGGGSDVGLVTITIKRVVCVGESVSDIDGVVEGVFTLLETTNDPCKHYQVDAQASESPDGELITLEIPGDASNPSLFRGLLSFSPSALNENGELILGVQYDPDLSDGPQLRTLPVCVNPVFEDGMVVDADLPLAGEPVDTWCLAGVVGMATGAGGELVVTYQTIGLEDPGFSAR